ncbi:MAG: hypothetical protein ACPIOQ_52015, partial [Promethearchaeia archaeon]
MISVVLMLAMVALLAHLRGRRHSYLSKDDELSFVAPESAPEERSGAGQTTMMPRPAAATPPKQASMGIVDDGTGIAVLAVAEDRRNEAAAMERKQMLVLESQVRTAQESLMQIKQKRRGRMLMHLAKASGLAAAA